MLDTTQLSDLRDLSVEMIYDRYATRDAFSKRFPEDIGRFDPRLHSRYTWFKVRAHVLPDVSRAFNVVCDASSAVGGWEAWPRSRHAEVANSAPH